MTARLLAEINIKITITDRVCRKHTFGLTPTGYYTEFNQQG